MTSRGRLTVPNEMRADLGLAAGSKVTFVRLVNGEYRVLPRTHNVMDLAGLLYDPNRRAKTLDDEHSSQTS
ncbi:AbrB/MazE/SpoVT family DNA-binding domain-containing protein [Leucobacter denitrificans]